MSWSQDTKGTLEQVLSTCRQSLLLCSPFLSRWALDFVSDRLPSSVGRVEVWTRLEMRDWITRASDPEALKDFIEEHTNSRQVVLRTSRRLHAKFLLGDGGFGAAGSANLTFGGLSANLEILRLVSGPETQELEAYVQDARPRLTVTPVSYLTRFLRECEGKRPDQAALVGIIKEYSPPPPGPGPLETIEVFDAFCRGNPSYLTAKALSISTGEDHNNRTGHIHQSFFAAQRFLQDNPRFIEPLAAVALGTDFDPATVPGFVEAWIAFLNAHLDEVGEAPLYPYAFSSIKRHLTETYGGSRTGGGGWNPPFRTVWPIAARIVRGEM